MHTTIDRENTEPRKPNKNRSNAYKWIRRIVFLLLSLVIFPVLLWLTLPLYWKTVNPLLQEIAGVSLSIESLSTGFDGINPSFTLKKVNLYSTPSESAQQNKADSFLYPKTINQNIKNPTSLLHINTAQITIDLRSIFKLKPILKRADIDQLTLHGWQDPDRYYWLAGFKLEPSQDDTPIDWLWIRQQQAHITQARLIWHSAANASILLPMTLLDVPVLNVLKTERGHEVDARMIPNKHLGEPTEIKASLAHSTQILNGQGHLAIPLIQVRHIPDIFMLPSSASTALQQIDTVSIQGNLSWTPHQNNISELSAKLNTEIKPHTIEKIKQLDLTASATAQHQGIQSILQKATLQAQFSDWFQAYANIKQPTQQPKYDIDISIPAIYLDKLINELNDFGLLKSLSPDLRAEQWVGEIENITAHLSGISLQRQLEYQNASASLFIQSAGWKDPVITGGIDFHSSPNTLKNKPTHSHELELSWNIETLNFPALGLTLTQLLKGSGKQWAENAFKTGELNQITGKASFNFDDQTHQTSDLRAQTQAQVKQLGLNYWSTYPAVDQADGILSLEYNPNTQAHDAKLQVKTGNILGYQLLPSTVSFLSIEKNSMLQVKANGSGDVSQLFSFIDQAPLPSAIKEATKNLSGSGNSSLQFQMDLPIGDKHSQLAISTHASFAEASIEHKNWGNFNLSGDAGWTKGKAYSFSGLSAQSALGQVKISRFDSSKQSLIKAKGYLIYGELLALLAKQGQNADRIRYVLKGEPQSKIAFDLDSLAHMDPWISNRLNVDLSELSIDIPTLVSKPSKAPLNLVISTQQASVLVKTSSTATVLLSLTLNQPNQPPILDIGYEVDKRNLTRVHSGHINIGRSFVATAKTNKPNQKDINAIDLALNKTPISPSTEDSAEIEHRVIADIFSSEFDLDQLREWFNQIPKDKKNKAPSKPFTPDQLHVWANTFDTSIDKIKPYLGFIPTQWDINTNNLIYQNNKTGSLAVELVSSAKHAKIQIQHKNIDGFLEWRQNPDRQTIFGRFERLSLTTQETNEKKQIEKPEPISKTASSAKSGEPNLKGLEKTKQVIKPWQDELLRWSAQPVMDANLDIEVAQLLIGKNDLGTFSIKGRALKSEAGREQVGFVFDSINLNTNKTQINMSGHWYHQPKKVPSVQLSINVDSSDFGGFLSAIGQPKILSEGKTQLQFVVGWDKHIAQIDFATLSGNLNFNIQNGYILPIDSTALRLLGLLSFQNITKIFDVFKKTSQEGFAFDQLEGKAKISRGLMKLGVVQLKSPPLDATISGDIDLKQETQNLRLLVKPRVDVGNFSALYALLINPIVGLGTLALGLFANKAFTIDYQVTGTFEKPVLQKN